jgi:hypothetical protein
LKKRSKKILLIWFTAEVSFRSRPKLRTKRAKVFWFFFSKKNILPFVPADRARTPATKAPATWATCDAAMVRRSHFHPTSAIQPQTPSGPATMPSKPNYNHQRAERDRAKKAAKEMKLQERKQQAALRKAGEASGAEPTEEPVPGSGEQPSWR